MQKGLRIQKIDCFKCKHHFITYQKDFPYGCKLMGFKSKRLPSQEVFDASGEPCKGFELKVISTIKGAH